jgi:hypothetical protein
VNDVMKWLVDPIQFEARGRFVDETQPSGPRRLMLP